MAKRLQVWRAMEELSTAVQRNAAKTGDPAFLTAVGPALNRVCAAVAETLLAQSCAVFFVDHDLHPEESQKLIMRGACGRLARTLRQREPGYEYKSYVRYARERRAQGQPLEPPKLSHIAWHCGLARWANTRAEMERLRQSPGGGSGDLVAYPGDTIDLVFRNTVIVPIFAEGRVSPPRSPSETRDMIRRTRSLELEGPDKEAHMRFMRSYRVIGLLKAENKRPRHPFPQACAAQPCDRPVRLPVFGDGCPGQAKGRFPCPARGECEDEFRGPLRAAIERGEACEQLLLGEWHRQMMGSAGKVARAERQHPLEAVAWGAGWGQVCRGLVDFCTTTFDATFSNEDVELLVALAMELGRILPQRTMHHASEERVALDESEVGSLLIAAPDVKELRALHRASDHIGQHMQFLLEQLKADLAFEEQLKATRARRMGLLEPRNPIREIEHRTKTYTRLLRKAILRHGPQWEEDLAGRPGRHLFTADPLVTRLLGRYDIRDTTGVRVTCDYLSDIGRVISALNSRREAWQVKLRRKQEMLGDPDHTGYRAVHLDLLVRADGHVLKEDLEALRPRLEQMPPSQRPRCPRPGFRLGFGDQQGLWLPCELQIRTAYQDSWAKKSHSLVYKMSPLTEPIPKALRDLLAILANNLYEADRLSDNAREQILVFLGPAVRDELDLLGLLSERLNVLPRDDLIGKLPLAPADWPFAYMAFALQCAKRLYRDHVRYTGEGHYAHAVSIALELVRRFGFFPDLDRGQRLGLTDGPPLGGVGRQPGISPRASRAARDGGGRQAERRVMLFALGLLHDCWLAASNEAGVITGAERKAFWETASPLRAFWKLLARECGDVIREYEGCIQWRLLLEPCPRWVTAFLQEYRRFWREELGDVKRDSDSDPADEFWAAIRPGTLNDEERRDVCLLRAAMLIDRVQELPQTPNAERRRERFRRAYGEFRRLKEHLGGRPGATVVLGECYKVMQSVATALGVEIPVQWYE